MGNNELEYEAQFMLLPLQEQLKKAYEEVTRAEARYNSINRQIQVIERAIKSIKSE